MEIYNVNQEAVKKCPVYLFSDIFLDIDISRYSGSNGGLFLIFRYIELKATNLKITGFNESRK